MVLKCFWQETCWIWGWTWWLHATETVVREACGLQSALRRWGWPSTSTAARYLRLGPISPSLSSPLSKRQPSSLCCSCSFSWACWLCAVSAFCWTPTAACLLLHGQTIWRKTHLTTASREGLLGLGWSWRHICWLPHSLHNRVKYWLLAGGVQKVAWCLIFRNKTKQNKTHVLLYILPFIHMR